MPFSCSVVRKLKFIDFNCRNVFVSIASSDHVIENFSYFIFLLSYETKSKNWLPLARNLWRNIELGTKNIAFISCYCRIVFMLPSLLQRLCFVAWPTIVPNPNPKSSHTSRTNWFLLMNELNEWKLPLPLNEWLVEWPEMFQISLLLVFLLLGWPYFVVLCENVILKTKIH